MNKILHLPRKIIDPLKELSDSGQLTGILLILATLVSMTLSNSRFAEAYSGLWKYSFGIPMLTKTLSHWINDGLMVLFFFLVGLEIKREILVGELARPREALLPVIAAIGGMIAPALIFIGINWNDNANLSGWAIPTATDIAFSLGILSLLGKRAPLSLKIFLTALAIIDDLGAILIIAAFYTRDLQWNMLLYALIVVCIMFTFNRLRVKYLFLYVFTGLLTWFFILKSGIHPTLAGVITAFLIPRDLTGKMEHFLVKPVNFIILPLFALANTAIPLSVEGWDTLLFSRLSLGITLGLIIGKPLGILLLTWLGVKLGVTRLPTGTGAAQMLGTSLLAGIGFTMSLFIATLSFESGQALDFAKLSIIAGSTVAAILGSMILAFKS